MRLASSLLLLVLLSACANSPKRPNPPSVTPPDITNTRPPPTVEQRHTQDGSSPAIDEDRNAIVCRPEREHRDEDYTPGGLYAPDVDDSAPRGTLDISAIREPVPRSEPRSRYGNRSPYTVLGKHYRVLESAEGYVERGVASWYGAKFNGRTTSNREIYDMCSFSAAHRTLPLPTIARVTNLDNGQSVIVRVNDRGPFHAGRLIDLSYAAAVKLGVDRVGTARVEVRALDSPQDMDENIESSSTAIASPPAVAPAVQMPAPMARAGSGRRFIQVGSYADKDNARRLAERLRDADVDDVDLDKVQVQGRDVWRVRIGPMVDAEMTVVFALLRRMGISGARVFGQ